MEKIYRNFNCNQKDVIGVSFREPNICPMCKIAIKPIFIYGWAKTDKNSAYAMFECRSCFKIFMKIMEYLQYEEVLNRLEEIIGSVSHLVPTTPVKGCFSKYISNISPQFIEIHNQANDAESYGLNEIAGIGYRKSIEFLIKDYLKSVLQDEDIIEEIKAKPLGKCINDYINSPHLKTVASRAVWIGNDETHYVRKHTNKDITDLKLLIDVTVRWIETECMTREAEEIEPM